MRTLTRYVFRLYVSRALATTMALTALLLVFDVLANASAIIGKGAGVLMPVFAYAALRAPDVISLVVPLAALLASMMVYGQLVMTSEMVAARAAGVSVHRVIAAMILGAGVLAVAHTAFQEFVVQHSSARLRLWAERDYRGMPPEVAPQRAPTWFAAGDALVHVSGSATDGRRLQGVTVVRRSPEGRLTDIFTADWARFRNGFWQFHEVHRPTSDGPGAAETMPRLDLVLPISPGRFSTLAESPAELGLEELWTLRKNPQSANRPASFYNFWLHRKLAHPAGALVMVLIAAPVALQAARRNRMLLVSFATILAGFLFFVSERVLVALGETGMLPAAVAAWTPAIVFASLGLWVVISMEE
ncbi:LPS export ABC transporter permease LptG [Limimonas halophila]|uniref:LPS export ABC transporter permease LptG n=1 Tax=Limimonas halophila TaxID=1082479 RepID=A0A1G7PSW8_9PROT|nr:LptF/LptG family permease [Limimonas halophila]SDF88490.1 LPS export ABC transporter permease LptG [Limimonas halophila]